MLKEKIIFSIFLLLNAGLAFHCVTMAVSNVRIQNEFEEVEIKERTKDFFEIAGIQSEPEKQNSSILRFSLPSKFLCLTYYSNIKSYDAKNLQDCTENSTGKKEVLFLKGSFEFYSWEKNQIDVYLHSDYPNYLFFQFKDSKANLEIYEKNQNEEYSKRVLSPAEIKKYNEIFKKQSPKIKIYQAPNLFLIYHSSRNKGKALILGLIERESEAKQSIITLYWDFYYIKDEKEFQRLFWLLAVPFAIAIDIVTLPLQGLMYLFGILVYLSMKP